MRGKAWRQIYPADCYRVLLMLSGKTGISFPKLVNIVVREGLIRLNPILSSLGIPTIPAETSEASLLSERPIVKEEKPIELDREILKVQSILIAIRQAIVNDEEIPLKSLLYAKKKAEKLIGIIPEAEQVLQLIKEKGLLNRPPTRRSRRGRGRAPPCRTPSS